MAYKLEQRKTLTACISPRVLRIFDKYLADTFFKSRSRAIESILIDHLFAYGYIDEIEYTKLRGGYNERY